MLHCRRYGSGPEVILAIHGWSSVLDNAQEWLAVLGEHFTILTIHLPGYAGEPDDIRAQSMTFLLEQIAATVSRIGFTHFHLLGFSMGAQIATQFAARYPAMIDKLVLLGPRPPRHFVAHSAWWTRVPYLPRLIRTVYPLEYWIVDRGFAAALALTPGSTSKHFRPVNVSVHGAFDTLVAQRRSYRSPFDTTQPTLYIWGEFDRMKPDPLPKDKETYLVSDAGHWVFAADPAKLAKRISKFLRQ